MTILRIMCLIIASLFALCCGGCRKVSENDIIGKWVYKINLPEKAGMKNVKEASIEFFDDKTFTSLNMPMDRGDPNGKVEIFTGSGTWKIDNESGRISLHFLKIGGIEQQYGAFLDIVQQPAIGDISLSAEYRGYYVYSYYRAK